MTLITPEERVRRTADLFESLEESVQKLRKRAEDLCRQLEAGEDTDIGNGNKQLAEVEKLISACRKVEMKLDEHSDRQAGIVRGGYALDLDVARIEVGCRLARLRTCFGS